MAKLLAPENTAVIYARFSSSNQREESIDAQVRACQDYAKRNGLHVIDIYADSAKTGTNAERENFQKMISDSGKGRFRYVIIHKLDRFSRDRYDSVTYKRKLKINGVTLRSVLENLDGSPESQILESMLEGMAAYYSQNLSREALKGQLENGYKCLHNGGIPPLGYDVDKDTKRYVINEDEAEIVRFIFSQYANGIGYGEIISSLNAMGRTSKRGRKFGKNSLYSLLQNPKYTGLYTFNLRLEKDISGSRNPQFKPQDEWICIKGGMPAIIDQETFEAVQIRLKENKKRPGRFNAKRQYLLSGLLKCGICGSPLWGKSHKDGRHGNIYLNYECAGKGYKKQCPSRGIKKEYAEMYVLDELQNTLFNEASIKDIASMLVAYSVKARSDSVVELEHAITELDEVNSKVQRIIELVASSGIKIDTVKDELKKLEVRKADLETFIREIQLNNGAAVLTEDIVLGKINTSKGVLRHGSVHERREVIDRFIEQVTLYPNRLEVRFKISVPSVKDTNLTQLTVSTPLDEIKDRYKSAK